jgi:hypothetical protein
MSERDQQGSLPQKCRHDEKCADRGWRGDLEGRCAKWMMSTTCNVPKNQCRTPVGSTRKRRELWFIETEKNKKEEREIASAVIF